VNDLIVRDVLREPGVQGAGVLIETGLPGEVPVSDAAADDGLPDGDVEASGAVVVSGGDVDLDTGFREAPRHGFEHEAGATVDGGNGGDDVEDSGDHLKDSPNSPRLKSRVPITDPILMCSIPDGVKA
jgi:hypothetical protein